MENIKVYTIEEIAEILKVGKRALYIQIREGKLKAVKVGREWRITESALNEYLNGTK